MKTPSLLPIIPLFLAMASSAQEPAQTVQPRLAPAQLSVEHRAGLAPWLDVRAEKRQYYAYRNFAPPDILTQLDRPVASPAVRKLLAQRSATFQSGSRRMRLAIDPDSIVNLGAEQAQDAASVAVVDLGRSPELWSALSGELRLDAVNNYVIPVLTSRYAQQSGGSTYLAQDTLMVTVAAKNHSRVTLYALEDGRWNKVSDLTPADVPDKDPVSLKRKLRLNTGTTPMQYQGLEKIALANSQASVNQTLFRQVSSQQWRDLATRGAVDNPRLADTGVTMGGTKPKPAGSSTTTTTTTTTTTPPQRSYLAYGQSPWCNRQCSAGACFGCCAAAHAAEQASIVGASLACHIASDLCPWCHIGCSAMTGTMFAAMANMDTLCLSTCPINNRTPASNNPNRCPVQ